MEYASDRYYIKKVLEGDTNSFAPLLDRYSRSVFALVVRIVRNREDAEELTQDIFVKAFRNLASFKSDSSFSSWLYRIAYNTAISATRKTKHEFLVLEETQVENVSEEEVAERLGRESRQEQLEKLDAALVLLPPDERALIFLFYKEEKSIDEIAAISRLSPSNVKVKLHRIRKKLFVLLKGMEER